MILHKAGAIAEECFSWSIFLHYYSSKILEPTVFLSVALFIAHLFLSQWIKCIEKLQGLQKKMEVTV